MFCANTKKFSPSKQYLSTKDLSVLFGENGKPCSKTTALRILREIKAHGDKANVKGKVLVSDYLSWYWAGVPENVKNYYLDSTCILEEIPAQ